MNPHCCEQLFPTKPAGFISQNVSLVLRDLSLALSRSHPAPRVRTKPHTFSVPAGCTSQLQSGDTSVFAGFIKSGPLCAFSSPFSSAFSGMEQQSQPWVMGHSPCVIHHRCLDQFHQFRGVFGGFKSTPVPCCKHPTLLNSGFLQLWATANFSSHWALLKPPKQQLSCGSVELWNNEIQK